LNQVTEVLSKLQPSENLEWAVIKRQEGNQMFEQGEYEAALQSYLEVFFKLHMAQLSRSVIVMLLVIAQSLLGAETAFRALPRNQTAGMDAKTSALCNMAACALQLKVSWRFGVEKGKNETSV